MKAILLPLLLIAVLPASLLTWHGWDSSRNRGYEFGYYGACNRVRHTLEKMPGMTITQEWANTEMFDIEEFGFVVTTQAGQLVNIGFSEDDPTRDLSGEELARTLTKKIQTRTAEMKTHP